MIFTTDALLALAVITIATTAFTVFAAQTPEYGKQVQLAQLGRDYLKLGINDSDWFYKNTGLHMTTNQNAFANRPLTVNALLYEYPDICRCTENSCQLERDACLRTQEIQNPDDIVRKVWVSP